MADAKMTYAERQRVDGKFPIVLRFASMAPADVAGMVAHGERRIGDLSHIDLSRTQLNRILVGADPDDPTRTNIAAEVAAECDAMSEFNLSSNLLGLSQMGRRKDLRRARRRGRHNPWTNNARSGPPLREGVLTLHRAWFAAAGDCPAEHRLDFLNDAGERAAWDRRKCDRFVSAGLEFLKEEFGDALRYCRADFDEQSVHLQFLLVDSVREKPSRRYAHGRHLFRLTQHRCIGGTGDGRTGYEVAQDTVAEFFARDEYRDMNIVRGESRAARKRAATAEVEALKESAEASALFGETPELPAGSENARAAYLLKQKVAESGGRMRKDARQAAALDFLAALGVVSEQERHEASTRRARQALIDRHAETTGDTDAMLSDPDAAASRVAAKAAADRQRADQAAAAERRRADRAAAEERARRDLEAEARREAEEEEHRRRLEEERREAEKKRAALEEREAEVERKTNMLNDMLREFMELSEHVKTAARQVGLLDHPLVQTAARAGEKMRDLVGRLGGWERTR